MPTKFKRFIIKNPLPSMMLRGAFLLTLIVTFIMESVQMSRFKNQNKKIKSEKTSKSQMKRKNIENALKKWDNLSIDSKSWIIEEIKGQMESIVHIKKENK